jgi:uncharacterized protein DUF4338
MGNSIGSQVVHPCGGLEDSISPSRGARHVGILPLSLVVVRTDEHMRIWNELMIGEHPQGAGPLVGRQLRYLIDSEYGWLGGFGSASSALHLADRDRWIGWDDEQRRSYLHTVVGMSRFLIRPRVECRNLASKALGMAMGTLADDFNREYNYRCGWWRVSWTAATTRGRAIERPTGYRWARPKDAAARIAATRRR